MTGYGSAEVVDGDVAYVVELRSVNHRYLKINFKLAEQLQFAEPHIDKWLRESLGRGSVTYLLRTRRTTGASAPINAAAVRDYLNQLAALEVPASLQASVDLANVVSLAESEGAAPDDLERARLLDVVKKLTDRGVASLLEMRSLEGTALRKDLQAICGSIGEHVNRIQVRSPVVIVEYHQRLRTRVDRLLKESDLELEADALAREVALFADRCDVSEEITRLKSHVDQFQELCDSDELVGRKLEFLTQELLREANTIGSKSNDVEITRNVLDVKTLVDRLREQVQNVE